MTNPTASLFSQTDYSFLMQKKIRKVLLICSSYDAFTLEEDGRLETELTAEYLDLNLSTPPVIERASSAREALERLGSDPDIDLIITMLNVGEIDAFSFAKLVKQDHPDIPVVLLSHFSREISLRLEKEDLSGVDYVFCWMGNASLILTIIKLIEDRMNAEDDILEGGVQAILLVEDSIKYYSTYLPELYQLVLKQSHEFVKEDLNEQRQMLHKRARPKILLARTYTEALELYSRFHNNFLGIISDVSFKKDKRSGEPFEGGIALCRLIREKDPLLPFLLQSSHEENRAKARELGVGFIHKYAKTLLLELSDYITREFNFGDFVFQDPKTGEEVARAGNLEEMQEALALVPDDVLLYHSSQNHISKWMYARGLFGLGEVFRDVRNSHFPDAEGLRQFITKAIGDYRSRMGQGVVARFDPKTYNDYIWFARMGEGSLGGKARGLAFINSMLRKYRLFDKYEGVRISIPRTVVIATDYFTDFIMENGLQYVINSDTDDKELLSEFIGARLPVPLIEELKAYIKHVKGPLAVRSSSKLEDSYYQPFAGVYSTYMIPRTENEDQMLRLLSKAIKSVYASVFFSASRSYLLATSNVLSEERMAVVLQEVCGTEDRGYFFPTLSGVARSLNHYPLEGEKPEDGVANVAFGLGKLVMDGGATLRFSPKYPKKALQLSTPQLALRDTQREMYALDLRPEQFRTSTDDSVNLAKIDIQQAADFRNMRFAASTWDRDNERIVDSFQAQGRKIITFANVLKYGQFPLPEILSELLEIGRREMKSQVEIEFAVNLDVPPGEDRIFNFLQIRPAVEEAGNEKLDWSAVNPGDALLYAESALGLGRIPGIRDVVYVRESAFDPARTRTIAEQLDELNVRMREEKRNYVLIGPGRWGSSDPWLGVPVQWANISEARVIVECGLKNFRVDPSQGTHFFQNLTSFGAGYLTVNPFLEDGGRYDSERLDAMEAVHETEFIRHVRFDRPLFIFIDGKNNKGIIH